MYRILKKLMKEKLNAKEIEQHLWHGTCVQHTPHGLTPLVSIFSRGFNRNYSGSAGGKWWLNVTTLKLYV